MKKFTKFILISFFFLFSLFDLKAAQEIKIVHLKRMVEREPTIYSINPEIINNGILGSRMGIKDNNTTGKFTNQKFELIEKNIMPNESAKEIFEEFRKNNYNFFILDVSSEDLDKIISSDILGDAILINVSLKNNDFRNQKCDKQLLHTAPSYMMVTDALMQFLKKKNWTKLFLIFGTNNRDKQFKDSLKISVKKFGLTMKKNGILLMTLEEQQIWNL